MSSLRLRRTVAIAGAALLLTSSLTGCSLVSSVFEGGNTGDATRDDEGQVTEEGKIDIFALKVGDCKMIDSIEQTQLSDTSVVPCSEPHDEEVYYEFDLPEGDYPGDAEIEAQATPVCEEEFATYVGISEADSQLSFAYFWPTQDGWEQIDDRLIQCVLFMKDESQMTSSMKGAKI